MPDFLIEQSLAPLRVCGIDEAGRGPWAGAVVAACVHFCADAPVPTGLNDSKKLSARMRDALFDSIMQHAAVGVGVATVEEIDALNIWGATSLAMRRALAAMPEKADHVLIDGKIVPRDFPLPATALVQGDSRSCSIAAASIIAKVTRDRMMQELHAQFPHYGFARHMGYGTAAHQHALREHGICPAHRKSFRPIRVMLEAA